MKAYTHISSKVYSSGNILLNSDTDSDFFVFLYIKDYKGTDLENFFRLSHSPSSSISAINTSFQNTVSFIFLYSVQEISSDFIYVEISH